MFSYRNVLGTTVEAPYLQCGRAVMKVLKLLFKLRSSTQFRLADVYHVATKLVKNAHVSLQMYRIIFTRLS